MPIDGLEKFKKHIVDLIVLVIFVFIAVNVYKGQAKNIAALSLQRDDQIKKNEVLGQIQEQEIVNKDVVAVINSKDVTQSLGILSSLAKQADVKITSLRPAEQTTLPFYTKFSYGLVVEASSYHAIAQFVSLLESHPNIYMVDAIAYQPLMNAQENRLDKIIVTLKVSTVLVPQNG